MRNIVSKLTDAEGEQLETQHWLEVAFDCNYLSLDIMQLLLKRYESVGSMLNSMIRKSTSFCRKK